MAYFVSDYYKGHVSTTSKRKQPLSFEKIELILNLIDFKKSSKYFYQTLYLPSLEMHINLNSKKAECYSNFNATTHLHKGSFKRKELPESVKENLKEINWIINHLDITSDFATDKLNSFLLKHDKRLGDCQYTHQTYFMGFDKKDPKKRQRDTVNSLQPQC